MKPEIEELFENADTEYFTFSSKYYFYCTRKRRLIVKKGYITSDSDVLYIHYTYYPQVNSVNHINLSIKR